MRIIVTSMFRKLSTNHVKTIYSEINTDIYKTIGCAYNALYTDL